jgi:hypothetical protein
MRVTTPQSLHYSICFWQRIPVEEGPRRRRKNNCRFTSQVTRYCPRSSLDGGGRGGLEGKKRTLKLRIGAWSRKLDREASKIWMFKSQEAAGSTCQLLVDQEVQAEATKRGEHEGENKRERKGEGAWRQRNKPMVEREDLTGSEQQTRHLYLPLKAHLVIQKLWRRDKETAPLPTNLAWSRSWAPLKAALGRETVWTKHGLCKRSSRKVYSKASMLMSWRNRNKMSSVNVLRKHIDRDIRGMGMPRHRRPQLSAMMTNPFCLLERQAP